MAETDDYRDLDAMTLPEVWAIVTKAWTRRRRNPTQWRCIAYNVRFSLGLRDLDEKEGA